VIADPSRARRDQDAPRGVLARLRGDSGQIAAGTALVVSVVGGGLFAVVTTLGITQVRSALPAPVDQPLVNYDPYDG
jgi:hypothetical protein